MQTQAIGVSNVKFKGISREQAEAFVNMDNSQLRYLAEVKSYNKQEEKRNQQSLTKLFYGIPVVSSLAGGILYPGTLGAKTMKAVGQAGEWAGVIAAIGAYGLAKNAVVSSSPTLQDFEQRNPVLSLIADVGIISTGYYFGIKGLNKIMDKHPKPFINLFEKMIKTADDIDKTKFAKNNWPKITKWFSEMADKAPWAAKAGKFALINSVFIMLGIALVKGIKHSDDRRKKVENNYKELKKAQFETSKYLVNRLAVERDILAQEQQDLACYIGELMDS